MISVAEVEDRFYSNLPVREDEMVIIPFANNDGTFGVRSEPCAGLLRYAKIHDRTLVSVIGEETTTLFSYYNIVNNLVRM